MIDVEVIETSSLGDRSYLATDGEVAVVVDPQRDVDRVLALAGRLGVRISHVVETHVHNDYVSGGLELARLTGAAYVMSAQDDVAFARTGVVDGDVLEASPRLRLRVLAAPGHTFHLLSYVLEGADGPQGVFTGGSLLYGTTGRTDLLGDEHAQQRRELLPHEVHHRVAVRQPAVESDLHPAGHLPALLLQLGLNKMCPQSRLKPKFRNKPHHEEKPHLFLSCLD